MWKVESQFFIGDPMVSGNPRPCSPEFGSMGGSPPLGHSPLCAHACLQTSFTPSLQQTFMHAWSTAEHGHTAFVWALPLLWIFFVSDELCGLFLIFPYLFFLHCHKKGSAGNKISILTTEFPFPFSGHGSVGLHLLYVLDGWYVSAKLQRVP